MYSCSELFLLCERVECIIKIYRGLSLSRLAQIELYRVFIRRLHIYLYIKKTAAILSVSLSCNLHLKILLKFSLFSTVKCIIQRGELYVFAREWQQRLNRESFLLIYSKSPRAANMPSRTYTSLFNFIPGDAAPRSYSLSRKFLHTPYTYVTRWRCENRP